MTYRKFLKDYRRVRRQTTPDIRSRLPEAERRFSPVHWARRCAAAGAAVTVLAGVFAAAILLRPEKPLLPPPVSPEPQPDSIEILEQIPLWYSPGQLSVSPIYYEDIPDGFGGYVNARFLDLTGFYSQPEHETCTGVYLDREIGVVACMTHEIRQALIEQGLGNEQTEVRVHIYRPALGKAVFTLPGKAGKPSYCYDQATSSFIPLSISLYQSSSQAAVTGENLSDCPYYFTSIPPKNGQAEDGYVIDLRSGKAVRMVNVQDTLDDVRLSPGGQYVLYTKASDDVKKDTGPARTTAVYAIETGKTSLVQGEIVQALPDDSRLILRAPDGVYVYTYASGERMPISEAADLPEQYHFALKYGESYTEDCEQLALENLLTGEETPVSDTYIYAWTFSRDYQYLYTFTRGNAFITCMEVATGRTFIQPVDDRFIAATEEGEVREKQVLFNAYFDEENNALLLGYTVCDTERPDPEAVKAEWENDPGYQMHKFFSQGDPSSLSDLAALMEKYPDGFELYQGEDFLYMTYHNVYIMSGSSTGRILLLMEDYRTHRFYRIQHEGMDFGAAFRLTDSQPLPEGAREATQALIQRLGLSVSPAPLDYGEYIVDGEVDNLRVYLRANDPDRILSLTRSYVVRSDKYLDSAAMQGETAMADLAEFLRFAQGLTYRYVPTDVSSPGDYGMLLFLEEGMTTLSFGKMNGKPYLQNDLLLAELTEEEYARWLPWFEACAKKRSE